VPSDEAREISGQSENGRLWDVLMVLHCAIRQSHPNTNELLFKVMIMERGKLRGVEMKALMGPGDEGEPVMTIMLPDED